MKALLLLLCVGCVGLPSRYFLGVAMDPARDISSGGGHHDYYDKELDEGLILFLGISGSLAAPSHHTHAPVPPPAEVPAPEPLVLEPDPSVPVQASTEPVEDEGVLTEVLTYGSSGLALIAACVYAFLRLKKPAE